MTYQLIFTPAFKISLSRLYSFLQRKYSRTLADDTKLSIKNTLEKKLGSNPLLAPISDRLLDLGITGYRQLLIDEHNIVIYRVDTELKKVIILLVFDSRQNIQKLLTDINLLL
jgi:plasmid stabilization system protein ParE